MRAIRLIAATDEYDRSPGLIVKGVPPSDGMAAERGNGVLIAHDVIEHMNGLRNIGTVWDELEAFGAIWHVRGRWGDLMNGSTYYSPTVDMGSEIGRFFEPWLTEPPGPPMPNGYASDQDEDFDAILTIARSTVLGEAPHNDLPLDRLPAFLAEAKARLRLGYRKANRKYGNRFRGNNYFLQVRDAAAKAVKMVDYEGQEFVLRYCEYDATVRPIYEGDRYE